MAVRGAAAINDEFEVGYDPAFEQRWRRIELASQGFMVLVVLVALLGLLGRGPLSHRTEATADGRLAVDFEPIGRYGTSTQLTLHLNAASTSGSTRAVLSSALVEPLGLQRVLPRPAKSEADGGGIAFTFDRAVGQPALIRFSLKPSTVGPVHMHVQVGGDTLSWTQWVLP